MDVNVAEILQTIAVATAVFVGISQIRKNDIDREKVRLEIANMQALRTIDEQVRAANRLVTDLDEIIESVDRSIKKRGGQKLAIFGLVYLIWLSFTAKEVTAWLITQSISAGVWVIVGAMYESQLHNLRLTVVSFRTLLVGLQLDRVADKALEVINRTKSQESSGGEC